MSCKYCGKDAIYKCCVCGKPLCGEHARLRIVCAPCTKKTEFKYTVEKTASEKERKKIQEFVKRFWGEEEQLTFERRFIVTELPAYVARVKENVVGFASYAETDDAILIVALGILPKHQGSGIGKSLVKKIETEARKVGKKRLMVSTSNDDLPALTFYQSIGFQIYEVKPNVIAEKHGKTLRGIGGLPLRDELRLQKLLR